jgi:hypothetical protein
MLVEVMDLTLVDPASGDGSQHASHPMTEQNVHRVAPPGSTVAKAVAVPTAIR